MITKDVIVISASQFSFTDETTKKLNEGCTIRYLIAEDLMHVEDSAKMVKGHKPAKATLMPDYYHKFTVVPALYEMTLTTSIASDGKVSLMPSEFKLISALSVTKVAASGAKV